MNDPVHFCHAKGCSTPCKPEHLMCIRHWKMVPELLKAKVYATYRPGQCDDKKPSEAWRRAAHAAIEFVAAHEMFTPHNLPDIHP